MLWIYCAIPHGTFRTSPRSRGEILKYKRAPSHPQGNRMLTPSESHPLASRDHPRKGRRPSTAVAGTPARFVRPDPRFTLRTVVNALTEGLSSELVHAKLFGRG